MILVVFGLSSAPKVALCLARVGKCAYPVTAVQWTPHKDELAVMKIGSRKQFFSPCQLFLLCYWPNSPQYCKRYSGMCELNTRKKYSVRNSASSATWQLPLFQITPALHKDSRLPKIRVGQKPLQSAAPRDKNRPWTVGRIVSGPVCNRTLLVSVHTSRYESTCNDRAWGFFSLTTKVTLISSFEEGRLT